MQKLSLIVYLVFGYSIITFGQLGKYRKQPTGLYFGGVSNSEEQAGIGYYYFKNDSSFLFFGTTFDPNKKPKGDLKDIYTDTLNRFGKGKFYFSDSFLSIKFLDIYDYNIQNDTIQYHSYSKEPYDSLFISFKVQNWTKETLNNALISLVDTNMGSATNTEGISKATLPLSFREHKFKIFKYGFYEKTLELLPNNNVHEIVITLAKKDESAIALIPGYSFFSKFRVAKNKEMIIQGFTKVEGDIMKLKQILNNGYFKMPMQKYFIDKIINELNLLKK